MCKAEFNDQEKEWIREDGKKCYNCSNSYSISPELFECEYENGEKYLYCVICIGEVAFSKPEEIKTITRVIEKW